jgi:hypothetical protein
MAGHLLMTRLALAEGNVNEADANLKQSRSLVAKNNLARWTNQYERVQIELWLAQHKSWEIEHWLDEK